MNRKFRRSQKAGKSKKLKLPFLIIIFVILVISFLLYIKINTRSWNGIDKYSFASLSEGGDVKVTILDPYLNEETNIVLPGDTQVNVSNGYGTLRLKNVWQMGFNEKLGGKLLTNTIRNNFLFPVIYWSQSGLEDKRKFIFSPGPNNIPLGDRISMALFSLKTKGIDKTEINLAKSQFIKKQVLTDGTPGYIISGAISNRLTVYFSDNSFAKRDLKFAIDDFTGKFGVAEGVGEVLQVLGGKVVSIDRQNRDDGLDCEVFGKEPDSVGKIALLFGCTEPKKDSNFDVEIRLGANFAKRF